MKMLCLLLIISTFIVTGCTKNYKTVEDYNTDLELVKKNNSNLTIEAKQHFNNIELYYRA